MVRGRWLGRLALLAAVMFFFLTTAVLAAGLARPHGASQACCQIIGRAAIGLKNLLLSGRDLGHRSLHRAGPPCAEPARQAMGEFHLGSYAAGLE